jgi:hypothetical protein
MTCRDGTHHAARRCKQMTRLVDICSLLEFIKPWQTLFYSPQGTNLHTARKHEKMHKIRESTMDDYYA